MASRTEQKQHARAARLAAEEAEHRSAARRTRLVRLGIVLGLAVVAVAIAIAVSSGGGSKPSERSAGKPPAQRADIARMFGGLPQSGTTIGHPKAPYTLTEFADLQCPVCRAYTLDVLPSVLQRYVRSGKVRLDLKLRAFIGPDSQTAAQVAAAAAQQNRVWPFADAFYRNQGEENSGYVTQAFLRRVAGLTPGLDATKALDDAGGPPGRALLAADERLATSLGSNSTPDFYLRKAGSSRLVRVNWTQLTPAAFAAALDSAMQTAS